MLFFRPHALSCNFPLSLSSSSNRNARIRSELPKSPLHRASITQLPKTLNQRALLSIRPSIYFIGTRAQFPACRDSTEPRDSGVPVGEEVKRSGDGDGRGNNWTTSVLLFGLWAGLMYYVFRLSPDQTPTESLRIDNIEDNLDDQGSSYEGIFEGSRRKSSSTPSIKSIFNEFKNSLPKSSSLPVYDEPVYDEYDDDMFFEVFDLDKPIAPLELFIHIIHDKETNMLSIIDNGIGMTKPDLCNHLGTFVHSDTKFMKALPVDADISFQYRDVYFVQKLLYLKGDDGYQMNEVLVALWNIMGLWPVIYSMLLLPTGRSSSSKVPVWPFLLLSFFGGAYALIPYFVLWKPPPPAIEEDEIRKWPLNILESRITAWFVVAAGLGLVAYALLANGDVWTEFYQYFRESKFIHVMSLDFLLLSSFAPFWIYNDMTARRWLDKGLWLLPLSLVPLLGPALYVVLRPQLADLPRRVFPDPIEKD
ncbi:hypothetical protein IEQ34_021865 [Dendrobium chrysotoxum]|uniref:Uncharacterized protein n=1 Tax=Dendrobium chrysotoxum TaxID=161865 RepID=A0AAV7FJX0_DENCH|nr:hypothetical protein IEQ34_021865 [Dendrobium chrysotoxum]